TEPRANGLEAFDLGLLDWVGGALFAELDNRGVAQDFSWKQKAVGNSRASVFHGNVDDLAMPLERSDAHPIGKRGAQQHRLFGDAKKAAVEVIEVSIGNVEWDDFHLEAFGGPGQGV